MIASILILAAAGYTLLYLLLGGGLGGATLIFVVAKNSLLGCISVVASPLLRKTMCEFASAENR